MSTQVQNMLRYKVSDELGLLRRFATKAEAKQFMASRPNLTLECTKNNKKHKSLDMTEYEPAIF